MKTKLSLILLLLSTSFLIGCATDAVVISEPVVVYHGWYGSYYGPYYCNPSGAVIFGVPHGWHGYYHYQPHFYHSPPVIINPPFHHHNYHYSPPPINHPPVISPIPPRNEIRKPAEQRPSPVIRPPVNPLPRHEPIKSHPSEKQLSSKH